MSLKILSKDFSFYGLIDILQRSIGFILIPYYTRRLTPSEFGEYDIFIVISAFLFVLIDLQIIAGFNRFYHEFKSTIEKQKLIGSVILLRLILGLILALVFYLAGYLGYLESVYFPSFYNNRINWMMIVLFPISTSLFDALIAQSRMSRNKLGFALPSLISVFFSSIGAIITIEVYNLGISGILLSLLLGKFSASLISYFVQKKEIKLTLDLKLLKIISSYCFQLIPGWWLVFLSVYFARFFVYGQLGAEFNAILSVTMKSLMVINIFTLSFRTAWYPIAMSYIGNSNSNNFYILSNRIFSLSLLFILFASTFLIDFIIDIALPESYQLITMIFPLFITSTVISELELNIQLGNQLAKKTIWISIGSLMYFVSSMFIILNYTNEYKIYAIGFSLLIPSLFKFVITYCSSQYFWHINYSKKTLISFFLGSFTIMLYSYFRHINLLSNLELKILLFIIGLFLFFFANQKSDFIKVYNIIKKKYS